MTLTTSPWKTTSAAACALAFSLEVLAIVGWMRARPPVAPAPPVAVTAPSAGEIREVVAQQQEPALGGTTGQRDDSYYAHLRSKLHWVETRIGNDKLVTPDDSSRVLLAKSAAERASLGKVGLTFKDVYGIINAETSWIPRTGASKDGTPNLGLAQFEPATAHALGLRNPNDAVEAVHVAAMHMKEAAEWSASRLSGLKLSPVDRAEKLREGVSIFYNLSTRGRNRWNGMNTDVLPMETRLHIRNARTGARYAAEVDAHLASAGYMVAGD
jgi:hypothetical protein